MPCHIIHPPAARQVELVHSIAQKTPTNLLTPHDCSVTAKSLPHTQTALEVGWEDDGGPYVPTAPDPKLPPCSLSSLFAWVLAAIVRAGLG